MDFIEKYSAEIKAWLMEHGPNFILAVITLLVGLFIINRVMKMVGKSMASKNTDQSLVSFITSMVNIGLKALLFISVAGMVGIKTTSFVAIIGAAGLAVGLALQGTLGNFAGGVLVLLFKPYKVGHLITAQGHTGWVTEIQIFVTTLRTVDNKTVIIPNGAISNGDITNFSTLGKIRVDLVMGISYDSDIRQAKEVLLSVLNSHEKVLKDPAPFVGVLELADSSVNLAVHPYCTPEDYWAVYFDIYEQGKIALDNAGITIPFPQVDVHMQK
ncbi:MAG: mechanosensitive ion channel [Bacteroidetes bacterium]|nr:mechanosensitive ion channel [Bacteroidota bacterium]